MTQIRRSELASLTTYLRFPAGHHGRIRHSNFIERTFGETRRRVKVIGRLPGERTCLGLVWAVLDRASRGWRGVVMTPIAVRQLQDLRRQLFSPTTAGEVPRESAETVTAAAQTDSREACARPDLHRIWDATTRSTSWLGGLMSRGAMSTARLLTSSAGPADQRGMVRRNGIGL